MSHRATPGQPLEGFIAGDHSVRMGDVVMESKVCEGTCGASFLRPRGSEQRKCRHCLADWMRRAAERNTHIRCDKR